MKLNTTVYNRTTDAGRVLIVGPSLGGNSVHQWTKVAADATTTTPAIRSP